MFVRKQIAHRLEVWGYTNKTRKARVLRESAQADFGFVAAISNRQVLLLLRKGELLQYSSASAPVLSASEITKLFQPHVVLVSPADISLVALRSRHRMR